MQTPLPDSPVPGPQEPSRTLKASRFWTLASAASLLAYFLSSEAVRQLGNLLLKIASKLLP